MAGKILITARSFRKADGPHKQILREAGYELVESPNEQPLSAAELAKWVVDVDGAILGLDDASAAVFAAAKRLRVLSRYGVGVDKVDVAAATRHGVVVTITPGANSVAVAELAIGLLLALARHIPEQDRMAKTGKWTRVQGFELNGSTLGLVGLGRIGREVARRAVALGMHVLFYDPFVPDDSYLEGLGAEPRPLGDVLALSDVVSLHVPDTAQTRRMIDAAALAQMKAGALLINTARAAVVDHDALYKALMEKRLAGAASDVADDDPSVPAALVALDSFIATPHAGAATAQTVQKMGVMAARNALAVLCGSRPEGVVNPEVYAQLGSREER